MSDDRCPFCGLARAAAPTPARWTMLFVGLCLAACTSNDAPAKPDEKPPEVAPQPTAPEVNEPPVEPEATTDPAAGEGGSEGVDDGSAVEPPVAEPKPMQKYGAPRPTVPPRPTSKYGAPPPAPKPGGEL